MVDILLVIALFAMLFAASYFYGVCLGRGIGALLTIRPAKLYRDLHRTLSPYDQYAWDKPIFSRFYPADRILVINVIRQPLYVAVMNLLTAIVLNALLLAILPLSLIGFSLLVQIIGFINTWSAEYAQPLRYCRDHIKQYAPPRQTESLTEKELVMLDVARYIAFVPVIIYIISRLLGAPQTNALDRFLMERSPQQMVVYTATVISLLLLMQPYVKRLRNRRKTVRYQPMLDNPAA